MLDCYMFAYHIMLHYIISYHINVLFGFQRVWETNYSSAVLTLIGPISTTVSEMSEQSATLCVACARRDSFIKQLNVCVHVAFSLTRATDEPWSVLNQFGQFGHIVYVCDFTFIKSFLRSY